MKIRKVLLVLIFLIFTATFLMSCAKLVSEEYIDVEATITDTYYRPSYMTPMRAGNITTFMIHPATYSVTVEYNGVKYNIGGSSFYHEHKNEVGKSVKVICHKGYYDDGSIRQNIIASDNY